MDALKSLTNFLNELEDSKTSNEKELVNVSKFLEDEENDLEKVNKTINRIKSNIEKIEINIKIYEKKRKQQLVIIQKQNNEKRDNLLSNIGYVSKDDKIFKYRTIPQLTGDYKRPTTIRIIKSN